MESMSNNNIGKTQQTQCSLKTKYPKSIPILLNPLKNLETKFKKHKFIVPKHYTFSKFISVIRNKCDLNEYEGLFFFIDGTLPVMSETMEQIYNRRINDQNDIMVIDVACENTFGGNDTYTTIQIVVDNLEIKLFDALNTVKDGICGNNCEIDINVERLPIGDIVVRKSDDEKLLYVFERKTMADLRSSIVDGRWKEQKQRLLKWFPREVVVYIIEDFKGYDNIEYDKWTNTNTSAQISSILNTIFRDNLKVIFTESIQDTARFLYEFASRCEQYSLSNVIETIPTSNEMGKETETRNLPTLETLKNGAKKNSQITKDNIFQLQLSQIPGISYKTSEAIKTQFPNGFMDLAKQYTTLDETMSIEDKRAYFIELFKDIPISYNNNTKHVKRRFGVKNSRNLVHYLLP